MSLDFRLAYNSGVEYVDLFPVTSLEAISGTENSLKITPLSVTIPSVSPGTIVQSITIPTTDSKNNSQVSMLLVSSGNDAIRDYSTIDQFQVNNGELIINRFYNYPISDIDVILLFYETGV